MQKLRRPKRWRSVHIGGPEFEWYYQVYEGEYAGEYVARVREAIPGSYTYHLTPHDLGNHGQGGGVGPSDIKKAIVDHILSDEELGMITEKYPDAELAPAPQVKTLTKTIGCSFETLTDTLDKLNLHFEGHPSPKNQFIHDKVKAHIEWLKQFRDLYDV